MKPKWDAAKLDKLFAEMKKRVSGHGYCATDAELVGYWLYRLKECKCSPEKK